MLSVRRFNQKRTNTRTTHDVKGKTTGPLTLFHSELGSIEMAFKFDSLKGNESPWTARGSDPNLPGVKRVTILPKVSHTVPSVLLFDIKPRDRSRFYPVRWKHRPSGLLPEGLFEGFLCRCSDRGFRPLLICFTNL